MSAKKRFLVGGGGALMPVLISVLAIDIGAYLDSDAALTTGNIIGICIRYLVLFLIGGVVAYLHENETNTFKLFELGIAAPALLTSLISAQAVITDTKLEISTAFLNNISVISSANAEPQSGDSKPESANKHFLNDLLKGFSGVAYRERHRRNKGSSQTGKVNTDDKPLAGDTRPVN